MFGNFFGEYSYKKIIFPLFRKKTDFFFIVILKLAGLKSTRSSSYQFIDRSNPSAILEKSRKARNN